MQTPHDSGSSLNSSLNMMKVFTGITLRSDIRIRKDDVFYEVKVVTHWVCTKYPFQTADECEYFHTECRYPSIL